MLAPIQSCLQHLIGNVADIPVRRVDAIGKIKVAEKQQCAGGRHKRCGHQRRCYSAPVWWRAPLLKGLAKHGDYKVHRRYNRPWLNLRFDCGLAAY